MSPKAIEARLKLVGELTRACLLIRHNSLEKIKKEREAENFENYSLNKIEEESSE